MYQPLKSIVSPEARSIADSRSKDKIEGVKLVPDIAFVIILYVALPWFTCAAMPPIALSSAFVILVLAHLKQVFLPKCPVLWK
jgi:hypothetical protein